MTNRFRLISMAMAATTSAFTVLRPAFGILSEAAQAAF